MKPLPGGVTPEVPHGPAEEPGRHLRTHISTTGDTWPSGAAVHAELARQVEMLTQTARERDDALAQLDGLHRDRQTLQVELARVRSELSASEALFGFMGWLTCREEVSGPFSAIHNATQAADLVAEFQKHNKLSDPRDGWSDRLVHPPAALALPGEAE